MDTQIKAYQVAEGIYLLLFKHHYDMGMHFLRYQEFYESPKFRNKAFTILEFMEWYAKEYGEGAFTYPKDWAGFNIPGDIVWKVHSGAITDYNQYDASMIKLYNQLSGHSKHPFYLLGCAEDNLSVLDHELAHGLYFSNKDYRSEMDCCANKLSKDTKNMVYGAFKDYGYAEEVFQDELQAYMGTGLPTKLKKLIKHTATFKTIFDRYTKNINLTLSKMVPLDLNHIDHRAKQ